MTDKTRFISHFRGEFSSGSDRRGCPCPPLPYASAPKGLTARRVRAEATATAEGALELPTMQQLKAPMLVAWSPGIWG